LLFPAITISPFIILKSLACSMATDSTKARSGAGRYGHVAVIGAGAWGTALAAVAGLCICAVTGKGRNDAGAAVNLADYMHQVIRYVDVTRGVADDGLRAAQSNFILSDILPDGIEVNVVLTGRYG